MERVNTLKNCLRNIHFALVTTGCIFPAHAADLAKFEKTPPDAAYTSTANVNDIERCLIRLDGAGGVPHVYSQPDRAAQRMIVWLNDNNDVSARVDLVGEATGTKVVAWRATKKNPREFAGCAPR